MDLRRFRYFVRVAEDGSLTRAAGVLGIAQPALTRQIHVLEEELGTPLFRRTSRGMSLTDSGEALLASIAGPLRELDLAVRNVRAGDDRIEGDYAVGMTPGMSEVVGYPLARRIRAEFPDIRLRIVEGVSGSLQDWLTRGVIDFGLLEHEVTDGRLSTRHVLDEPLMLIGRPAMLDGDSADLSAALRLPLILPTHHLGIRATLNQAATARGLHLNAAIEVDAPGLALRLVQDGFGIAVLPLCLARLTSGTVALSRRVVRNENLRYRMYLTRRSGMSSIKAAAENRVAAMIDNVVSALAKAA